MERWWRSASAPPAMWWGMASTPAPSWRPWATPARAEGRGQAGGDGEHTVAELVDLVSLDPRRGVGHEKVLTRLELDHQALRLLEQAGLTAESGLPAGGILHLRSGRD